MWPARDRGKGLFGVAHFQVAYATNDIDAACALFRDRFGIGAFRGLSGPIAAGGTIRVELAWSGGLMYELMTASGPGSDIYMDRLSSADFALRLHHLGYLVEDEEGWAAMIADAERNQFPVAHMSQNTGFMRSCFIDAAPLGHYLEYILPEPAGRDFFESVPVGEPLA